VNWDYTARRCKITGFRDALRGDQEVTTKTLLSRDSRRGVVGLAPEELTIAERMEHAGKWAALELYTPTGLREENGRVQLDVRLRRIQAFGDTVEECVRQLRQAGLDPRDFEFTELTRPY